MRFWSGPLGARTARLAGVGVRPPDRSDLLSRVPRVVHLLNSEIERINEWIEDTSAFESEQKRDVTLRLQGNLAALEALRARLEAPESDGPDSASLTSDLAAAQAVCDMAHLLLEANGEVEEACRPGRLDR